MKVSLVQFDIIWHDPAANRGKLDNLLNQDNLGRLVILPEMFSTGFTMHPEFVAEEWNNSETLQWMKTVSLQRQIAICGSLVIKEDHRYFNRLIFIDQGQILGTYDKKHLFTLAGEQNIYTSGSSKLIVKLEDWNIQPLICYDLRFPIWCFNESSSQMMIFCANWPDQRIQHWDILLQARAIENQSYVIGVNRIGKDDNGNVYSGHSKIISPQGNILGQWNDQEGVFSVNCDLVEVHQFRSFIGSLSEADKFKRLK